ncbi:MAG: response regulator [Cyanobacteria bacterium SZAS LIN-2]|nr:response regulator [Cyanobacteria bacterium SZAS LIN-3]MBS1995297.1 response regulator [Cyanobacteria bacterium SZAS LIN-2]
MSFRLLLIEDSPTQLLTIAKTLQGEGYSVIEARNGAEGLARAYNELPDLIISDVVMTGINGYQLCRLVKNDPDLGQTPVILLTKLDGSVDRFWGFKSGADRYIPKEPGFSSLIKATKELLEEATLKPRLRIIGEPSKTLTGEDVNNRLNQLLERLLFEATIVDEVRRIAEDILDLDSVTEKLIELLSSILDYQALGLVINQGKSSVLRVDASAKVDEGALRSYIAKIALQLGLPPLKDEVLRGHYMPENALTQPIDITGQRLGLLVVVPYPQQIFKPGDQKVVRLIGEQLSVVLRLLELKGRQIASSSGAGRPEIMNNKL